MYSLRSKGDIPQVSLCIMAMLNLWGLVRNRLVYLKIKKRKEKKKGLCGVTIHAIWSCAESLLRFCEYMHVFCSCGVFVEAMWSHVVLSRTLFFIRVCFPSFIILSSTALFLLLSPFPASSSFFYFLSLSLPPSLFFPYFFLLVCFPFFIISSSISPFLLLSRLLSSSSLFVLNPCSFFLNFLLLCLSPPLSFSFFLYLLSLSLSPFLSHSSLPFFYELLTTSPFFFSFLASSLLPPPPPYSIPLLLLPPVPTSSSFISFPPFRLFRLLSRSSFKIFSFRCVNACLPFSFLLLFFSSSTLIFLLLLLSFSPFSSFSSSTSSLFYLLLFL